MQDTSSPNNSGPTLFAVGGMTCQGCARSVTEAAQRVEGVRSANVDLLKNSLEVTWKPGAIVNNPAVQKAVEADGYTASIVAVGEANTTTAQSWSPTAGWKFNLMVGGIATV